MTATRATTISVLAAGLLAALTACAAPSPTATPEAVATTPAAVPSATPTPTAPPEPPTCQNVIGPESLGHFTERGLVLTESSEYAEKIRSEGYSMLYLFQDNGGVLCPWASGMEYDAAYAFSPITGDEATRAEEDLEARGYVATEYAGGLIFTDATGEDYLWSHYLFIDGYWFAGTGVELIDEVVAHAPH